MRASATLQFKNNLYEGSNSPFMQICQAMRRTSVNQIFTLIAHQERISGKYLQNLLENRP